jgi:hypothetical protein
LEIQWQNQRNPILPPDIHLADPEAHVMPDGKLYLYGSLDAQSDLFCSDLYRVVSTPDLNQWTIHEVAFQGQMVPWFSDPEAIRYSGIDWSRPTPFIRKMLENAHLSAEKDKFDRVGPDESRPLLFAPDCIHRDGRYFLYFCMPDNSEGVAVSGSPAGPFVQPVQLPVGGIDPAVFIDEDQQAYFFWGQLFARGAKLNPDMVSLEPASIVENLVTEETHFFHEGSSVRKIGNLYYLVYCCMERGKPTSLGYATSYSPLGPYTYRGIILDNAGCDPSSWNNHGSIEKFNGQWYIFYHRSSRGSPMYRRLCIEPINILPDGTIPEVKMTSQGIGLPFAAGETIQGYQACELTGNVRIGRDSQDRECLTGISAGDTACFRYAESPTGFRGIRLETTGRGAIEVELNSQLAGRCLIGEAGIHSCDFREPVRGDRLELTLRFRQSEDLSLISCTLG